MSVEIFLKYLFRSLPEGIQSNTYWAASRLLHYKETRRQKKDIHEFENKTVEEKKREIFRRVKMIAVYAQNHNRFYKSFYRDNNFNAEELTGFSDIRRIPVVTKALLRSHYADWQQPNKGARQANTGGTSGSPLVFYVEKHSDVKELAYFDHIWGALGYSRRDRRAVFRGIDIGEQSWIYHKEGDAYCINQYLPWEKMAFDLKRLFEIRNIKYLHGYPSAVYSFAHYCLNNDRALLSKISENLKGIFLGSEYPAKQYRRVIDEAFHVPSISWYGHSERCILATEREVRYQYSCLHSYGFCEALDLGDGETRLIGTSYDNYSSPFIRYDTGDSVEPSTIDDLMMSFKIRNARIGEFILDSDGHPVPLTALIFGRHHKIFDIAEFIQVSQPEPGKAVLHITTTNMIATETLPSLFDLTNVKVMFGYQICETPHRTKLGKVPLLISPGIK